MHELPTTKDIHQIVVQHAEAAGAVRVLSVNLEVGALTDLQDEWVQRYFDHLSRGTIAEGARVKIDRLPAVFRCNHCRDSFEVDSVLAPAMFCPECDSSAVTVESGRVYRVRNIEII